MFPLNSFNALIIFAIALLTAKISQKFLKITHSASRYESIDGLRGFLALAVFIHHSTIWHHYLHTNSWQETPSNLYNHLGKTSVSLFFMITSFLFVSKLLNTKDFNWKNFFISRIFRLFPMYYFVITLMFIAIFAVSNWKLNTDLFSLLKSVANFGLFTIIKTPEINNFTNSFTTNAGVFWSLPFEWLFYFTLPLISLFIMRKFPPFIYILISVCFILLFTYYQDIFPHHVHSFIGGAIAPFIIKYSRIKEKINHHYFSIALIICIILVFQFKSADFILCKILIVLVFTLIAVGNNVFGLLKSPTLKFLGEICYSTYLIHGIILFSTFYFVFGIENVKNKTPFEYTLIIYALTPILVIFSYLGYKYIEKPFMNFSKKITNKSS